MELKKKIVLVLRGTDHEIFPKIKEMKLGALTPLLTGKIVQVSY